MRETVPSKTPWINEYPAEWRQIPLHVLFKEHKCKNKDGSEQNLLSLSYGNVIRKDINTNEGLLPENFNGYNIVENGDIILRLTDLQNDHRSLRTGLALERGIITSAYVTLRKNMPLSSEYYHYLLHSFDIMKVFYSMGEGIRQSLDYGELARIVLPCPPLSEQQAIASFLDKQCAAIDEAIEKHKKIIERLEEYKVSTISYAVTVGLHSKAEFIKSGSMYVPNIPEDWTCSKIKMVLKGLTDGTHGTYARTDFGRPLLSAKNVFEDGLRISNRESYISEEDYQAIVSNGYPKKNDVLLCCVGTIGRCSVYTQEEPMAFQRSVIFMRVNENILPDFLKYAMSSQYMLSQEMVYVNQAAQAGLYQGAVKNLMIAYPKTIAEQEEIVRYLDALTNKTNSSIDKHLACIAKLEEYRKSLIYNAVTGKIDCREVNE